MNEDEINPIKKSATEFLHSAVLFCTSETGRVSADTPFGEGIYFFFEL